MYLRIVLFLLGLSLVGTAGCTASPRYKGIAAGSSASLALGVTVDADLRVVEVTPASAAERAAVRVGDVLVSLTWITSERPEALGGPQGIVAVDDGNQFDAILPDGSTLQSQTLPIQAGEVVTNTETVEATPMPAPPNIGSGTVPFTDRDGIHTLISYGVPLRLRVLRDEQILRLTIIPTSISTTHTKPTDDSDGLGATPETPPRETF